MVPAAEKPGDGLTNIHEDIHERRTTIEHRGPSIVLRLRHISRFKPIAGLRSIFALSATWRLRARKKAARFRAEYATYRSHRSQKTTREGCTPPTLPISQAGGGASIHS